MKLLKSALLLIGLFTYSLLCAQKKELKFGKISRDEMKMRTYEKDTLAKAVVLFDKGITKFHNSDNDYNIQFIKHKRIKILDKTATEHLEVTIPYYVDGYGKTEIISNIKAITYTLDKDNIYSETKLNPEHIYDEQINERWHQKKFVFSNVQDGSVIEYQYELETPFHFNLPDWNFQDKIPTVYSEYSVAMIPFYVYVMRVQGIEKFDYQNSQESSYTRNYGVNGSYKDYIHSYVLKDIPAFKDESYITSINDYIIKMDFQLSKIHYPSGGNSQEIMSTWPILNKALLKHKLFGKYIDKSKRYAKKVLEEKINITSTRKQDIAQEVILYVKNNYKWNGRNSKYTSQSVKDFIETGTGNSADINLFLIALLNQVEIKAEPIILSTRDHGKITASYPFDNSSNYVIALVHADKPFLTDATERLLPYNLLPFKCMNEKGLLVNENENPSWIDLTNKVSSLEKKTILLQIDPKTLEGNATVNIQSNVYKSFINRNKFKNDISKIKEYYQDIIGEVQTVKSNNYDNIKRPYTIGFKAKFTPEIIGNKVILKPLFKFPLSKNHLTLKERSYPVDFEYLRNNLYECYVNIPEGYELKQLPQFYHANDDLVNINLDYKLENRILKITGNYTFKKSVYVANEYTRIKSYIDHVVKHFNQPVLLEKQ